MLAFLIYCKFYAKLNDYADATLEWIILTPTIKMNALKYYYTRILEQY